jgi:EAL domain-containing protein (putative c-di-GMP-specific phosphodiesterase class I)/GGDEF domain-containing protein
MKLHFVIPRVIKNIAVLLLILLSILTLLFWLFFADFKEKAFINAKKDYELNIDKYINKFENKTILFDNKSIQEYIKDAKNTDFIKDVRVTYKRYLFNKENLVFLSGNFTDSSWNLADITTDIKFGEIKKVDNSSYFEFIPSTEFNLNENLMIKYQLFKDNEIKNFIIPIDLNLFNNQEIEDNGIEFSSIYELFYNLKLDETVVKELKIDDLNYATIEFIIDDYKLKKEICDYLNWLVILVLILGLIIGLPITVFISYYNKYLENKYIVKPVEYLDKFVLEALENKFTNIDDVVFEDGVNYGDLLKNISKLSNKVASLSNELNINRESLERNLLLDNLTGLYDKRMFDIDMKSMFVSSVDGFIFLFKIGKLNQVESMNGTNRTDDFILSTVTNIKNIINTYKDNTITFYRFNGSEFILLAREWNYLEAVDFADRILNTLNDKVVNSYKLPTNIFHIGGTPIDKYGTTDLIMKSLNEAYTEAVSKGGNSYKILEESEIKKKTEDTEATIIKLIKENSFGITFSFNSYSFDNQLLIRELKPILEDEQGNTLQIGSFISISEKLGLNVKFDEEVILKALDYAKENKIDYKIAVNLSIRTIANYEFLEFLEDLVDKDESVVNHILFSITSYSAFAYKQEFKIFVEKLNELNFKILMKRYKPTDYPFEKLSEVKIDYMKIDKELIKNIDNDLIKKHKMRNIVVFADVNNIKLMVENIESDKDYEFLSKLDLYTVDK